MKTGKMVGTSVKSRGETDVQIVRYLPLNLFPSGQLEFNNFHQVKRMIRGIGNVFFSTTLQTSKRARSSAYFGEPLMQMTTSQVALNCLVHCPLSEN